MYYIYNNIYRKLSTKKIEANFVVVCSTKSTPSPAPKTNASKYNKNKTAYTPIPNIHTFNDSESASPHPPPSNESTPEPLPNSQRQKYNKNTTNEDTSKSTHVPNITINEDNSKSTPPPLPTSQRQKFHKNTNIDELKDNDSESSTPPPPPAPKNRKHQKHKPQSQYVI